MNTIITSTDETSKVVKVDPKNYKLDANHRCDACQSAAYFRAVFIQADLHFCRHHYLKYEVELINQASMIYDESDKLVFNRHQGQD